MSALRRFNRAVLVALLVALWSSFPLPPAPRLAAPPSVQAASFALDTDHQPRPPIANPALLYGTFLGGSGGWTEDIAGMTSDAAGNLYVIGWTDSPDFPLRNPIQPAFGGQVDVFVAKFDAAGRLVYSTYLGGSGEDYGNAVAVDSQGNVYVTGGTLSANFPLVKPLQPIFGGGMDVFVAEIDATGTRLVYSTFLGGSDDDAGTAIVADAAGPAYVTGHTASTDFPVVNAFQPQLRGDMDGFVAWLAPGGTALEYSTYLGGSGFDQADDLALDAGGNVYLTGFTASSDFPLANPIQPDLRFQDAFVTKLNAQGSALVYSTYLGGSSYERGMSIALDTAGQVYLTGLTRSPDFPLVNPIQSTFGGVDDIYVTQINASGTALLYSTFLGGNGQDWSYAIEVDPAGRVWVTGSTYSTNFPTANPLRPHLAAYEDAFVAQLDPRSPGAASLLFSTYLGGYDGDRAMALALDPAGAVYVGGGTLSRDFPLTGDAVQPDLVRPQDAFVARIGVPPQPACPSAGWSVMGSYSIAVRHVASAAQNGRLYSFGGDDGFNNPPGLELAFRFNPATNIWTPSWPVPSYPFWQAAAVSDGRYLYILGGLVGTTPTNTLYRYDPLSYTYTALAPYATATYAHGAAYRDGKLYRIGGCTDVGADCQLPTRSVEVYDIATNSWAAGPDYPIAAGALVAAPLGDAIYTAGGYTGVTATAKTYRFDGLSWDDDAIADLPEARAYAAGGALNGRLLLAGGRVRGLATNTALAWDAASNRWDALPNLRQSRTGASGAVDGTGFYVIAGEDKAGDLTHLVERYFEAPCAPAVRYIYVPLMLFQ
jgi:hypothetical protein